MLKVNAPKEYAAEEWIRLPKPGQRFLGLTRSSWMDVINNPKSGVRSISIKQPGKQRGIRILYMPSVHAYFDRLTKEQEAAKCAVYSTPLDGCTKKKIRLRRTSVHGEKPECFQLQYET
jgi:hypothetical protein